MTPTRSYQSGVSAGVALFVGKGEIQAVSLAGGSANSTAILYDNASAASGTILAQLASPIGDTANLTAPQVRFDNGVFAVVTGTGASVVVYI